MHKVSSRVGRTLGLVVLLGIALSLGWIAAKATMAKTPEARTSKSVAILSEAAERTVGRSLSYSVTATRDTTPVFYNVLSGTVTKLAASGTFNEGSILYSVDNVAVRVIESDVVFYRDLGPNTSGPDVKSFQEALIRMGFLDGEATGKWTYQTSSALKAWNRAVGAPESNSVRFGELASVGKTPSTLVIAEELGLGKPITSGEMTVSEAQEELVFSMTLSPEQARLVPSETLVDVFHEDEVWATKISNTEESEDGSIRFLLESVEGGPICTNNCESLLGSTSTTLRAKQHVVPEVTGLAVPTAAVHTSQDGSTYVILENKSKTAVVVLGTGDGFTVVSGLNSGDVVIALEPTQEPEN